MPQDSFTPALARLDPASRALLDLSLRRDMRPEEIGDLLGTDPESVIVAREAALEQLATELGLDEDRDLDDLRVRLTDLPGEAWTPQMPPAEAVAEADVEPVVTKAPPAVPKVTPQAAAAPKKRRSRMPLLLGLLAVVAVVAVILLASGGGDDENTASSTPAPAPQTGSKPSKPSKSAEPAPAGKEGKLRAVGSASGATGSASLTDGGKRLKLEVTGLPSGNYEVWLFDSVIDAVSIGKATGTKIDLDAKLPPTASNYRYIDISREPADGNPNHSGESVMRVKLSKLSG